MFFFSLIPYVGLQRYRTSHLHLCYLLNHPYAFSNLARQIFIIVQSWLCRAEKDDGEFFVSSLPVC